MEFMLKWRGTTPIDTDTIVSCFPCLKAIVFLCVFFPSLLFLSLTFPAFPGHHIWLLHQHWATTRRDNKTRTYKCIWARVWDLDTKRQGVIESQHLIRLISYFVQHLTSSITENKNLFTVVKILLIQHTLPTEFPFNLHPLLQNMASITHLISYNAQSFLFL